ncbi:MAG: tRNA (adenosine(37)-N6)-threonylcarbamoyltransferase complex transferase subunit TsaD [Cardiobacteriaceae bacterium]|nr:tRNA (adenosine(37)-N6)-threonylcarbamoyltransferase complex transferase subunit TsaD [Cardiobacteriaceae bacterium]
MNIIDGAFCFCTVIQYIINLYFIWLFMLDKSPLILAVESSCDESAVALYSPKDGALANEVYSQIELHRQHGGVVPELAARDHLRRLPVVLQQALESAGKKLQDINIIAYTAGPGLLGALMTGAGYARALAYALHIPAIPIHHMEGHLLSPLLSELKPEIPFIALLVSGGHTQLMAVDAPGHYRLLGETLDDAVGEAFDKTAKLMELPYPGGPELSALAEQGDVTRFSLSRPMINRPGMDFSFSGLKTQVRLLIEAQGSDQQTRADIAAAFQRTIIETLNIKCRRAWQETGYIDLVVAGGVSANHLLRESLQLEAHKLNKRVFFPESSLCGDNALMIAFAAAQRFHGHDSSLAIEVRSRWDLSSLPSY